jgi:hypothetical protein
MESSLIKDMLQDDSNPCIVVLDIIHLYKLAKELPYKSLKTIGIV